MPEESFQKRLFGALLLSFALKLVTFTFTTLLTRQVSPAFRGMGFYVDLYADTIGFLGRESLRAVSLRRDLSVVCPHPGDVTKHQCVKSRRVLLDATRMINTSILSLPFSLLLVVLFEGLHFVSGGRSLLPSVFFEAGDTNVSGIPSMILFVLGIALQASTEPKLCMMQALQQFRVKISAESFALCSRLVVCLSLALFAPAKLQTNPLVWCCFSFCVYGLVYALVFEITWWRSRRSYEGATKNGNSHCDGDDPARRLANPIGALATILVSEGAAWHGSSLLSVSSMWHFGHESLSLWLQFFTETVLRLVLTEGEKFILAAFGTLSSQGVYDLVMNLGSLVARLIFRVWEESCFAKWAKTMASTDCTSEDGVKSSFVECYQLLRSMLALSLEVSVPFAIFGPPLSGALITFLYSSKWSATAAGDALALFCYALPFMAMNGLMEAFIRATGDSKALSRSKRLMLGTSGVYVVSCYVALQVLHRGVYGLVACLLVATVVRSLLSWHLIAELRERMSRVRALSLGRTYSELGTVIPLGVWVCSCALGVAMRFVAVSHTSSDGVGTTFRFAHIAICVALAVPLYAAAIIVFHGASPVSKLARQKIPWIESLSKTKQA